ncbi:MAG: hypothetical protein ACTHLE_09460 [Agriterribacter sp.]
MRKTLISLIFVIVVQQVSSQTFLHGAGVGLMASDPAVTSVYGTKVFFTLHYYPQVTFMETETYSVSAGVPLTVGLSGSYNASYSSRGDSYEENSLLAVMQVPLMVNFNGGAGATKESEQRFGYFIGGGFGYHSTGIGYLTDEFGNELDGKKYSKGFGPAANAGIRFAVGSNQKNIEVRFSYMKGLKDAKPSMFGLNAAFNF